MELSKYSTGTGLWLLFFFLNEIILVLKVSALRKTGQPAQGDQLALPQNTTPEMLSPCHLQGYGQ